MSSFSQNMERTFSENETNTLASSWDGHRQSVCCKGTKLILQDWWLEVIKFIALLKLIFTDFCNVLWGLKEMYRWNHHIKCTIYGASSIGLARYYILDPLQDNYIVYYPLSFVVIGCLLKIGSYANNYIINNPDSAFGSKAGKDYPLSPLDQHKFRKSQYYLGFSPLNPDDEVRMEFAKGLKDGISDWWINRSCDSDNLGTKNVMCDTLLCPTHKGTGTKEDPIDFTEDTDTEDDVGSGSDSDDSDDSSDKEVEQYCCNEENCEKTGEFEDLQEAYDNGWYQNDEANYCSDHAEGEVEKVDNDGMSEKDVLEAYGVRPVNPTPESDENKKDKKDK